VSSVPEKLHAELGASVASRWIACPGSVNLSRGIPNYETEHSRAGTAAHAVAELALRKNVDPDMWLGMTVEGVEVDEDMVEAVSVFVNYCRGLMLTATEYGTEEKFSLAELNPPGPMFGTTDFWSYDAAACTLEIVDYKNGSGVVVEVKGNKQLRYYALGAALKLGKGRRIETVRITIVQPRAGHPEGVVRSEEVDYLELLGFAAELMEAARETLKPDAPLVPGSHCRFCPASAVCPAQAKQAQELAQVEFADMPIDVPPAPAALPTAVFADMLAKVPILEAWIKQMYAHGQGLLERGEELPGFKLVPRRAQRKWLSEEQVIRWLQDKGFEGEEIYKMDLKSPAQIEKLPGIKKQLPADFVEKKSSGYTMVPASDPRPPITLTPGDDFAELPPAEVE
jgi:hypothetical protein